MKKKIKELKILVILVILFLIGSYVFKNHDDFPYYHLTYSLNLSENSFIVGTGIFSHGFRTFSSLFYYHSLLFMPFIDFYLFHIGPFFILIFVNYIFISKLISNKEIYKKIDFIHYFILLSLIFVNVVFYRLGEHGTDRSAQIILLLIFSIFFELIYRKKEDSKYISINLLLILIILASSFKAIYYLYLILIPTIFFKRNFFFEYFDKKNFILILVISLSIFLNIMTNYFNTGCLLYPASFTCIGNIDWSIPIDEVKKMKIHYEWWAKAGGGPGYISDIPKELYIKDFTWLSNWIDRHFFNKVSDTLGGILLISLIVTLLFRFYKLKTINKNEIKFLAYLFPLIFLIEWFLNHPAMRYGGFVLIALPIFIYSSNYIARFKIKYEILRKLTIFFIILSIVIFNFRNFVRINKEIKIYEYNILNSPFFYVEDVQSEKILDNNDLIIFSPKNGKMCWSSKTPCSYNKKVISKDFLWMKVVLRDNE